MRHAMGVELPDSEMQKPRENYRSCSAVMHRRRKSVGGSEDHESQVAPAPNMNGKVVVITGGNTGIGYATAKTLAVLGAHVIIACRSEERAVRAIHRMKEEVAASRPKQPGILVEYMPLDLSSLDSVRKFAVTLTERNQSLHVLINNAGISWVQYGLTEDGFEQHYQVNHLSHFLLTLELLPLMLNTAECTGDGRVIFVASRRHSQGVFDPSNINGETSYSRCAFYNNSKLYNVMTAYALQRRIQESGITVSSVHPGPTDTEMTRHRSDSLLSSTFVKTLKAMSIGWRSAEKGAATSVYVASQPGLNTQECFYYVDCRAKLSSMLSRNEEVQEQLWGISMRDVKEYLTPDTWYRYGRTKVPITGSLRRTRRHSSAFRHKPEDREQLIDRSGSLGEIEYDIDTKTEEGEEEGVRRLHHDLCV